MDQPTRPSSHDEMAELKTKGIFVAVALAALVILKVALGW